VAAVDLALCIGHDLTSTSAEGAKGIDIETERLFWGKWAPFIVDACTKQGIKVGVFARSDLVSPWSARQIELCNRVNASGARLVLDLHYNAYDGEHAGVCAVHHPKSTRGKQAADALIMAIAAAQETRALPALSMDKSWSGSELYVLTRTRPPAVILEPFFGDNAKDVDAAVQGLEEGKTPAGIAYAVRVLLDKWTGLVA
jgi:N-acetylmuramoyl-L-alanine amidase